MEKITYNRLIEMFTYNQSIEKYTYNQAIESLPITNQLTKQKKPSKIKVYL